MHNTSNSANDQHTLNILNWNSHTIKNKKAEPNSYMIFLPNQIYRAFRKAGLNLYSPGNQYIGKMHQRNSLKLYSTLYNMTKKTWIIIKVNHMEYPGVKT